MAYNFKIYNYSAKMSVKRKLTNPSRHFNSIWEEKYLFVKGTSKPQCLACLQIVSVPKEYNLKRHYETRHKSQYEQYDGYAGIAVVKDLKGKYYTLMTNLRKTNLSDKKASCEVSLILAENGKGFRDRETVKCTIFCLLFVRADVAVCGPRINIQKIIWPATLSTLDHPDLDRVKFWFEIATCYNVLRFVATSFFRLLLTLASSLHLLFLSRKIKNNYYYRAYSALTN